RLSSRCLRAVSAPACRSMRSPQLDAPSAALPYDDEAQRRLSARYRSLDGCVSFLGGMKTRPGAVGWREARTLTCSPIAILGEANREVRRASPRPSSQIMLTGL